MLCPDWRCSELGLRHATTYRPHLIASSRDKYCSTGKYTTLSAAPHLETPEQLLPPTNDLGAVWAHAVTREEGIMYSQHHETAPPATATPQHPTTCQSLLQGSKFRTVPEFSRPGRSEAVRRGLALQPRLDEEQRRADQRPHRPACRPGRQVPEEEGHLAIAIRVDAQRSLHRREQGQPRTVHQHLLN